MQTQVPTVTTLILFLAKKNGTNKLDCYIPLGQCDQIGRNFAIWATLGYFLANQFSPKQAFFKYGLL